MGEIDRAVEESDLNPAVSSRVCPQVFDAGKGN
jgi:hypothetical protein